MKMKDGNRDKRTLQANLTCLQSHTIISSQHSERQAVYGHKYGLASRGRQWAIQDYANFSKKKEKEDTVCGQLNKLWSLRKYRLPARLNAAHHKRCKVHDRGHGTPYICRSMPGTNKQNTISNLTSIRHTVKMINPFWEVWESTSQHCLYIQRQILHHLNMAYMSFPSACST